MARLLCFITYNTSNVYFLLLPTKPDCHCYGVPAFIPCQTSQAISCVVLALIVSAQLHRSLSDVTPQL